MTAADHGSEKRPPAFVRAADAVFSLIDRRPWISFAVAMSFLALLFVAFAIRIPFWGDEVLTSEMLRLPNFGDMIRALGDGCDQAAPLYYAILQPFTWISTTSEPILRLPSIAGYCAICAGVFAFALRRMPAPCAFVAMLFAANSVRAYAANARPYTLEIGCIALALVCWQYAMAGVRRRMTVPLLAALLGAAVALHLFAIFAVIPLFAGAVVVWRRTRRIDWAVLFALIVPALVIIPHRFMIESGARFAPFFWSKATASVFVAFLEEYYGRYLLPLLLLVPVLLFIGRRGGKRVNSHIGDEMPDYEWVAVVGLALCPLIVFAAGKITLGVFVARYVLWAVIGFSLTLAGLLHRIARQNHLAVVGCALTLFLLLSAVLISKVAHPHHINPETQAASALVPQLPDRPGAVLISDFNAALVIWHYGSPALRARVVYPVDIIAARRYDHQDTTALIAKAWGDRIALRRPDLPLFLQTAERFLAISEPHDWLSRSLDDAGYSSVRLTGPENGVGIYEWRAPGQQ